MILEACKLVNIAPSQAVYVGDQYTDILAGLRANVKAVIGIGDEVRDLDADFVVNSLVEISLKER
jgi:phosphoglycolate phosphatase-like HAD superfamily hydrolase